MIVTDLTEELLRRLELREIERSDIGDNITQEDIDFYMNSTSKKAVLDGNKVVMALGAIMQGVGCRTWVLGSKYMEEKPITSMKYILQIEAEFMNQYKPQYFFTYNLPDQPKVLKYLNRIGYHAVGIDNDFNDGKERLVMIKKVDKWDR